MTTTRASNTLISLGIDCASRKSGIAVVKGDKLLYHEPYTSGLKPGWSDSQLGKELEAFRERIAYLSRKYKVNIVVVELTGGWRNPNTIRALSYFEAAAVMGAVSARKTIVRVRTTQARSKILPKNKQEKSKVIAEMRRRYKSEKLTEDEAEAILFALYGIQLLM